MSWRPAGHAICARAASCRANATCCLGKEPRAPTSWELQDNGRAFPPNHLHERLARLSVLGQRAGAGLIDGGPPRRQSAARRHQPMTLQTDIEALWAARDTINSGTQAARPRDAVEAALEMLDRGEARVAEPGPPKGWHVQPMAEAGRPPLLPPDRQRAHGHRRRRLRQGAAEMDGLGRKSLERGRLPRRARVRWSAAPPIIAPNVVLMPSFVNLGAYVGANTMVDTWATRRLLRADREECAPLRRCRHRRRAGAACRPTPW